MRISSFVSFLGFVLIIAGAYCPLLRPLHLFNYDMFGMSKPYGIVVLLMAVVGILGVALDKRALVKTAAYVTLLLIIVLYVGAVFQVKSYFNFIPFKGIASGLSHLIKFKWGWYLLSAGALLAVGGTFGATPKPIRKA